MSKSAMVSGMGLAMSLIVELTKMVVELGGEEEDLHRLVTPEGRETLRKMVRIATRDGRPKVGDRAYTVYRGQRYEGELTKVYPNRRGNVDAVYPTKVKSWGVHSDHSGINVGYDDSIVWDEKAGMWYAPADYDR